MENYEWVIDIFAFIGMLVCIIIALIAIGWATCFAVKLLIKTFSVRVGKSYDLMVEDISKKAELKKERNEIKRQAVAEKKMEILNLKLENKQRLHEIKKAKLEQELKQKEEKEKIKLFGENVPEIEHKPYENVGYQGIDKNSVETEDDSLVEKIYEQNIQNEEQLVENKNAESETEVLIENEIVKKNKKKSDKKK